MLIRPQDIGWRYGPGCARIVPHSVNGPRTKEEGTPPSMDAIYHWALSPESFPARRIVEFKIYL